MTPLSPAGMIELWERGVQRHPLDRNLLLLASARPSETLQTLADVSIGQRDQALIAWRGVCFGRKMPAYVDCPACRTRLEFALDTENFRSDGDDTPIAIDGLRVRRPTSRDLAAVLNEPDPEQAAYRLAQRCCADETGELPALSATQLAQTSSILADADSAADIVLDLVCEHCGHAWQSEFDIGSYLWQEIEAHAARLMAEIHTLARAYGWSERDLLSMSPPRRAAYLGMAGV